MVIRKRKKGTKGEVRMKKMKERSIKIEGEERERSGIDNDEGTVAVQSGRRRELIEFRSCFAEII